MSSRPRPAPDIDRAPADADSPVDGYKRLQDLLHEDTVQGALRRALDSLEGRDFDLARSAAIDPGHLKDFYWGDAELNGEEIDRLARVLHLQLVPADH
jgi:hypothetical protein